MSEFIQFHLLTAYPPANLNRDDLGRPKTAIMGNATRLRVSSQSLKRAWRTSDIFENALDGHKGVRTKRIGVQIFERLLAAGVKEKDAKTWTQSIASVFGKLKNEKDKDIKAACEIEQLVHISQHEQKAVDQLVDKLIAENRAPTEEEIELLTHDKMAVDIALFGRMLASKPAYNVEAAAQVAHAITVHKSEVEDDYFTAVDDLNAGREDSGSAHIGEAGFGAGLFYSYICINKDLLIKNLNSDKALANRALEALTDAMTQIAPTGKQNSFASRAYASYLLVEKGKEQPRSLVSAFIKPIYSSDVINKAAEELDEKRKKFNQVYDQSPKYMIMNVEKGEGSLAEIKKFVTE